ncbi:MAG: hypothetical protein K0S19_1683, partial [Geminicoccaceae bacterium]|nr:hypothetical protein [Geminicoccaceae bacterium]
MGEGVLTGRTGGQADRRAVSPLFEDAGLERQDGALFLAGVSLPGIAEQVGTPA